jgi:hypothetical protein
MYNPETLLLEMQFCKTITTSPILFDKYHRAILTRSLSMALKQVDTVCGGLPPSGRCLARGKLQLLILKDCPTASHSVVGIKSMQNMPPKTQ